MTTTPSARLVSHWQRGCDDAKEGTGPRRPYPDATGFRMPQYLQQEANRSYMNGWRFGLTRRHPVTEDEGSHAD